MREKDGSRINYIYLFFLLLFIALALRISYLQIFKRKFLRNLSQNQYYRLLPLEGSRGKIFDCQGRILAINLNIYSIFADPSLIESPDEVADVLSLRLNLSKEKLKEKLQTKKKFVWVKRKISWPVKEEIKSLKLKGVGFIREEKRFYPQEEVAASVLGIVDIDNNGLEGAELFHDSYLHGKDGWVRVLQDSSSKEVFISPQIVAPQSGADLTLTIDSPLQYWTEFYLEETIKDFSAKGGSIVVMDALGGAILALANYPTFNPNRIDKSSLKFMRNQVVADWFEPGSVFKVITLLAAIEENKFSDDDKFFCEDGEYKIPGSTLHDWKPYGELTFKEVFKKSSNIGVGKIAASLGKEKLYRCIKKLGFGEKTGIDLPAEAKGILRPLYRWSKTSEYIIPIGQEIGISLIQLVRVFAAIANGGYLVRPHIVKTIHVPLFTKNISTEKKRVISSRVAQRAKKILIEVVEEGTGKRAAINGIVVGGKTGTAQKYDLEIKRYSPDKFRATFVGFVGDNFPFVIGITIDEPKKHRFGGIVAAPLFKKIAERVIIHYEAK